MNASLLAALLRGALLANAGRLALAAATIALGVALAGAVHTVHTSALAEIDRSARALAGSADIEVRGPRNGFDDGAFAPIARLAGVEAASPVVAVEAAVAGAAGATVRVLGIDPFRAARLQPALTSAPAGGAGAAAFLDPRNAWLSPTAAAHLGLARGDTLRLYAAAGEVDFRVAGILPGLGEGGEVAVVDIAAAQERLGWLGRITRIDLRLVPGVDTGRFRDRLAPLLPPGVVASVPSAAAGRAADISRAYRVNLDALAFVALVTGAFLVFSTLALQAAQRRRELALLRALGMTRRGIAVLLGLEGAAIGVVGAAVGTVLAVLASRAVLQRFGPDLGAGYFGAEDARFTADAAALGAIALLGAAMSVGGALWVARGLGRLDIAQALRDRALDLPAIPRRGGLLVVVLLLAGVPLLAAPPVAGLPLGGYAAIAAWLAAAVAAVGPACRVLLARAATPEAPVAALALAQVRHLPGHLAASVAGIVVSATLCAAMAIMVFSFRVSFDDWLHGVVHADLYVRAGPGGDLGYFTLDEQERVARLPEVAELETLRYDRLVAEGRSVPLTLIARPVNARVLAGFRARPPDLPPPGPRPPVWISEAARDIEGWKTGDVVTLPVAGREVSVRVAGIIRDYARTWGAVIMPREDYRRLTGDTRADDLAIRLAPGVDMARAESAVRAALGGARGIRFEDAAGLRRRSLAIFDRSFAITYALEAIAVAIGLAGVTSSFAALAWSRRREFAVLRFLGLRRRDVLRMLALEGAAAGALGAGIGLAAGAAVSLVLVQVVDRQSFHWTIEVHWPVAALAALAAAVVALCALGARASGALAVRHEAVAAVKDDA